MHPAILRAVAPASSLQGISAGRSRHTAAGVVEERISFERGTWTFNYPGPPSELVTVFKSYYGPTMNAFEAASANGSQAALQAELEALFNEQNTSDDATSLPSTYLRVRVTR